MQRGTGVTHRVSLSSRRVIIPRVSPSPVFIGRIGISYSTKISVRQSNCLLACLVLSLTLAGCLPAAIEPTPTSVATSPPPAPTLPIPDPTAVPPPFLWMPYASSGDQIWQLGDRQAEQINLPVSVGSFYGYSRQTQSILMSAGYPDHGAGPTPVTVGDLSILHLPDGQVNTLVSDDVVEALFAPNGQDIAYILARPTTYELHWRTPSGEDRLLASDVAFTWSIAPSGQAVAFTRESRYGVNGTPGLYVVSASTGDEVQLSHADKAGYGSTIDTPFWSPDGSQVVLPVWGTPDGEPRLVLARADGSGEKDLSIAPAQASEWWASLQIPGLVWLPDGEHWVAVPEAYKPGSGQPGGPLPLVMYRLDSQEGELRDGRLLGTVSLLIGWDIPGSSVWVMDDGGSVTRIELPRP